MGAKAHTASIASRIRRHAALSILTVLMLVFGAPAFAGQLVFRLRPPEEPVAIFGNAWTIYAEGEIDEFSSERLQRLIAANHIPGRSVLYLNSPGGSLVGGLKLGRTIRSNALETYVGRRNGTEILGLPGECYSACALAFLGGEFRWMVAGSKYGVHRFHAPTTGPADSDVAQVMSSVIVNYIAEMGVDSRYFQEMSFTGSGDINILSEARLAELGVVNNGQSATRWTVESSDVGVYLKGERTTFRGINKFMIVCTPQKRLALYTIFDAEGRGPEILQMRTISMFSDERTVPLSGHLIFGPTVSNGWMNAAFDLDGSLIERIRQSQTVGIAFQYTPTAGTFFGFMDMPISSAKAKLDGLLRLCR